MPGAEDYNIYDEHHEELLGFLADELAGCERVLEFGCGDCELSVTLARKLRVPVLGIDLGDGGFTEAFHLARRRRVKRLVDCRKADAERLDSLPDGSFSCAVSKWVLHELDHPVRALREIRRVLAPGGLLLCCDFTRDSQAAGLWGERYYTPRQAAALFRRAGFAHVSVRTILEGHAMLVQGRRPRRRLASAGQSQRTASSSW
ncbi:MAG: class I SAM-dependent methyltransferase [Armatimonadetes bacterium]|nr:class I SAM-dependent methyltransferase [Armatimonadota bacterium]